MLWNKENYHQRNGGAHKNVLQFSVFYFDLVYSINFPTEEKKTLNTRCFSLHNNTTVLLYYVCHGVWLNNRKEHKMQSYLMWISSNIISFQEISFIFSFVIFFCITNATHNISQIFPLECLQITVTSKGIDRRVKICFRASCRSAFSLKKQTNKALPLLYATREMENQENLHHKNVSIIISNCCTTIVFPSNFLIVTAS